MTTAAESPWSNGINERNNVIFQNITYKTLCDSNCSLALAWRGSTENTLANNYGFCPNQLGFGKNRNFPSILYEKLPPLENKTSSDIVCENLCPMDVAKVAIFEDQFNEKLR